MAQINNILDTVNGLPVCPRCRNKIRGFRVLPDTVVSHGELHCKTCKLTLTVDICEGKVIATEKRPAR